MLTNVRKITPSVFVSTFLQRGLPSLLLKTTDQVMQLEQL